MRRTPLAPPRLLHNLHVLFAAGQSAAGALARAHLGRDIQWQGAERGRQRRGGGAVGGGDAGEGGRREEAEAEPTG